MEKWCGKHEPDGGDACTLHFKKWEELHAEDLQKYNLEALFYCPVLSCDKFALPRNSGNPAARVRPSAGSFDKNEQIGWEIFLNYARLKILFCKLSKREGDGK